MAGSTNRREELMRKLQESEERSAALALEIEGKRRKLADMQNQVSSVSSSARPRPKREQYTYPKVVVPPVEPLPNLEDDPEYQAEMEKARKQTEAETDKLAKDMQARCKMGMESKLSDLSGQMRNAMDSRMSNINTRYSTHADNAIRGRSTDVLRTNKVIRDLSRSLGAHWKPVFLEIMKDVPSDVVQAEITEIETQRGFMQAYKALTIWKDLKGDDINMSELVNALRHNDLYELAEKTLDTLDSRKYS